MNPFYEQGKGIQWGIAVFFLLITFSIMGFWTIVITSNPLVYLLIFLLVPFFQFFMTPFFTLIGLYRYLSPMLLVYAASEEKYDLHNGTSFDYLWVMKGCKPGRQWRHRLLSYYLQGLLKIIEDIETGVLSEALLIRGSSYFFSESTARRLGFEVSETSQFEKLNIIINYLDLCWMYSLAHGKLTLPQLKGVKTAQISGEDLLKAKPKLIKLLEYLSRNELTPG